MTQQQAGFGMRAFVVALACVLCLELADAAEWSLLTPMEYSTFDRDDEIPCTGEVGNGAEQGLFLLDSDSLPVQESNINSWLGQWDGIFIPEDGNPWPEDEFYSVYLSWEVNEDDLDWAEHHIFIEDI